MPTTPAASVDEKASAYSPRPSRSAVTIGMIVVTASDSNAARKTKLHAPTVARAHGRRRIPACFVSLSTPTGRP